jgi:hypothetical protein
MSLHTLANHLQTAGRGDDKMLVHMTPHEVSGLQSLAMAHGGSLTVNPETGLPEAGFLSSILPMVAGAFLGPAGLALSPLQAGLVTGAAGAAMTGSLSKGLMMGLGAYSGAGLGSSLMGGTEGAVNAAGAAAPPQMSVVPEFASAGSSVASTAPNVYSQLTTPPPSAPAPTGNFAGLLGTNVNANAANYGSATPPVTQTAAPPPQPAPVVASPEMSTAPNAQGASSVQSALEKLQNAPGKLWDMLSGDKDTEKEREDWLKRNKNYLMAGGISALALSRDQPKVAKETSNYQPLNPAWVRMQQAGGNYQPSSYPSLTGERTYFADGGVIGQQNNMPNSQVGQPVEKMSQLNSVGANTNFPMANIHPFGYAVPRNYPVSQNVFQPESYERLDPYTGEEKFASGGLAALHFKAGGSFVSQIKAVPEPKKVAPKLQNTAPLEKQLSGLQRYSDMDNPQDRINDINNQIKGLNKKAPDYKSTSAQLSKDLKAAQADLKNYNTYKSVSSKLDAAKSANDKAVETANQQYEDSVSAYNDYKNQVADEKKAWEEQTARTATGLQSIKPQTATRPAVKDTGEGTTPTYTKDPKTGKLVLTKDLPPVTEFKKFGSLKEANDALINKNPILVEPQDVEGIFQNTLGRKPTSKEMSDLVGTTSSTLAIAKYAESRPDFKAQASYNSDDIKDAYKYYIGKDPSAGELASLEKANAAGKITNFQQLRTAIVSRPAYLDNLNAVAQATYTDQQKVAAAAEEEARRAATTLAPEDVVTAFKDVYGRNPNMDEMGKYKGTHQTLEGLTGELKGTDEYLKMLTQSSPLQTGYTAPDTTKYAPVTHYAPNTVLSYTPDQQTQANVTPTLGATTPPSSGLSAPESRGTISVAGAYPIAPDWYKQQIGIQNLATQAAEKATPLQGGLQFLAPQQPIAPQSIEALLAALRAQQAQQPQGVTQMASGGIAGFNLGGYSDGGRLLKGPGDGVSDSIPATIGDRQPARLADGEFVIPARIVSEIGNGSTDAGARKLYAMMQRIQQARGRTVGRDKVAVKSGADKMLPA